MQETSCLFGLLLCTIIGVPLALSNVVQLEIGPEISIKVKSIDSQSLDRQEPFSAIIYCSESYESGENISCQIDITNNHCIDYHVLKWYTPLEGMRSRYILVTRNGKPLAYDGMFTKRGSPTSTDYGLIRAGITISSKVDISLAFPINQTGPYTVYLQTTLHYRTQANTSIDYEQTLKSNVATFNLVGSGIPKKTMGEYYREHSRASNMITKHNSDQVGAPLDPMFVGGTAAQRARTKEVHRASYHYISAAEDDIDDNQAHYISWFGAVDAGRMNQVKQKWSDMKQSLETDVYTYHFDDPGCFDNWFAYTFFGATDIYLCNHYDPANEILGIDTKLCTIVHELSHAKTCTQDHKYGRQDCLDLADYNPRLAIDNGDNYCYFVETTNIFDYGFDSIARLPNKRTYVTRGNVYIRYSDDSASTIDDGYPVVIKGRWGNLPDNFNAGFDSMAKLPDNKYYVTKGNQYVRYSNVGTVDPGFPKELTTKWANLPDAFQDCFDSMVVFSNNRVYASKGNQYLRYSHGNTSALDSGYPNIIQGNWGNPPGDFANGYDAAALLPNGKIYVFRGKQYIRYSDNLAYAIDRNFPLPIRGNWGTIDFP